VTTLTAAAVLAGLLVAGAALLGWPAASARAQGVAGWSFIGPGPLEPAHNLNDRNWGNSSGRITSVAVATNRPRIVFIGAAGGGVWKSENGGRNWKPLTDNLLPGQPTGSSMAIGALWAGRSGQTVYAGTGELNGSDSQYGQGVLRSRDGGRTWAVTGRRIFGEHFIGEIAANRNAPGTVLVATDRGVYRSGNAGQSWRKIDQLNARIPRLRRGQPVSGQVYEIHQDPTNARKYWASFGDRCATEAGGIATSDNGGSTWKVVYSSARAGRIGLGVGPGGVAYAGVSNCAGSLLSIQKTVNGGRNWRPIPKSTRGYINYFKGRPEAEDPNGQGDYDNVVAVDPTNANRVVFGGITVLATTDGARRLTDVGRVYSQGFLHPDIHAIAFSGRSSFYVGEDGGLWHTNNMGGRGRSQDWTNLNTAAGGLRIAQFNTGVSLSATNLLGGTQDNGSPAATPGVPPGLPAMRDIASGDGGFTAIDPVASHTFYTSYPDLDIWRWRGTGPDKVGTPIQPCPAPPAGQCTDPRGFYAPFVMDLSNPQRLLAGTNRVYETFNARADPAPTWAALSPRLTRTDRGVLTSIALPPTGGDTIFTTSSDGEVARTTNGTSWTDITGDLPRPDQATNPAVKPFLTQVAFNPANPSEAWVTIGWLGVGQLWYTSNAGAPSGTHWVNLSGSGATALPAAPALSVIEVPRRPGTVDVGTYYGVWTCSSCGGQNVRASWQRLGGNNLSAGALPKVEVDQLSLTSDNNTLIAWTHGRGVWQIGL
jgi:hypothetical protein